MAASGAVLALIGSSAALAAPPPQKLPNQAHLRDAARWAAGRQGRVAWAVIDARGRLHGRHAARHYPSASLSKAFMLVAALRQVGNARAVPHDLAALLGPMIRRSSNRAAHRVYRRIGGDGAFHAVARAARLRHVRTNGTWSEVQITAADVARFFAAVDRLVPRRHRAYARGLLAGIVPRQSWGIPHAARARGWHTQFKGGWRRKLVVQGALVERAGRRVALAVLTDANPSQPYGRRTIEGITRRLLWSQVR